MAPLFEGHPVDKPADLLNLYHYLVPILEIPRRLLAKPKRLIAAVEGNKVGFEEEVAIDAHVAWWCSLQTAKADYFVLSVRFIHSEEGRELTAGVVANVFKLEIVAVDASHVRTADI